MKQTLLSLSFCLVVMAATAQDVDQQAVVSQSVRANIRYDLKAVQHISATNVVEQQATATYTAGKSIMLNPGFEARAGSVFKATIAPVSARSAEPGSGLLVSASPNPFQDLTTVEYTLPTATTVKHTLTDARGGIIRHSESDGVQAAGTYKLGVEGGNLPTGVYLYQVKTDNQTKVIRLLKQ
ncbi:T9SS type A sorting domain-containing protein [Fibrella sp. HMF5335]|uniref:T9SS type A sorting domain-containing protein n=1 Tax=Fibrella rubiginis TaxID=2817060 RepID=A0A939K7S0_9BACT|nr:T9SS type A sorting domain-containing protein [Fibrella rubiginis]MBO0938935.1 T9SS type A sorting domain-containing protein [Fibrella rubiginis]